MQANKINQSGAPNWPSVTCHVLLNGRQSGAPKWPSVTCSEMVISQGLLNGHQVLRNGHQ